MHPVQRACGLALNMLLLAFAAAGCCATMPNVAWQEGEDYVSAPEPTAMPAEHELAASGGKVLNRSALDINGNVVKYRLDLPVDMSGAKLIFRYARPWLRNVTTTPVRLTLVGPLNTGVAVPPATTAEVDFKNTASWGARPVDYDLLSADFGDLIKGAYSLELTALADKGSATIDGFFIAPGDFNISSQELDLLIRVKLSSYGYVGIKRPSIVVRQDAEKRLALAVRSFNPAAKLALRDAALVDAEGLRKPLAATQGPAEGLIELDVSALEDGEYVLSARMDHPQAGLKTPLLLAGKLIASLDDTIAQLGAATAALKSSGGAAAERCETDMEEAVEYLNVSKSRLMAATEMDENVWKAHLEELPNFIRDPQSLLRNTRRTVLQSQETVKRLAAGSDPYEGRFGDVRRAFRAETAGKILPYRLFVPSSYATASRTPLILMLHGAGDDENYFPDMDGGVILTGLEKRGFMAVMPDWESGEAQLADMPQLIKLLLKEYPKLDPQRVYCTGFSAGGYATYRLAAWRPELFAAIACSAGTGAVSLAGNLKDVPTLILQGDADPVVSAEGAMAVADKMKELGQVVELHLFAGLGHDYKMPDCLDLSLDFFDKHVRKP